MQTIACRRPRVAQWLAIAQSLLCLAVSLVLPGCDTSGSSGSLTPHATPSAQVEQQAIASLLDLYRQAIVQEDIDRLHALLQPAPALQAAAGAPRPASDGTLAELEAFRQSWSATLRRLAITAVALPAAQVQIAADHRSVTLLEVESSTDPMPLVQQTRVFRTTLALVRLEEAGVVTFRIAGVQRQGPLVAITTPGHVQAGALTRVQVRGAPDLFPLASAALEESATGAVQTLHASADDFHGAFVASRLAAPQTLTVRLRSTAGQELVVPHHYGIRRAGEGVVQRVAETGTTRFFAVTVAADGTVWAGGGAGARLYRVAAGESSATLHGHLLATPEGRVADLTLDELGRLHAVVFSSQASGVVVLDQGVGCQTVNVLDPTYPLRLADGRPSASPRAIAADGRALWLHGSDAGLTRVTDALAPGHCPPDGVTVTYSPVLRREDGALPANTVPALLAAADETLWVGSALGLSRLRQGEMTPVPFDPALSFQGQPATLEAFFQVLAQALFEFRPLTTVRLGEVSFVEAFGSPLVKADVVFSLAQDHQGQLWVGTLGGGLRRVEVRAGVPQDTLHLTRADGLASNMILALAVAPDGAVWAATDDGVSRIEATESGVTITTFTAGDGLPLPARDLVIDTAGTAWVATDGGLYRIDPQGGEVTGEVRDDRGQPVEGADVLLLGTSVRTVTDATGRFVLTNLPLGPHRLQVDGRLAAQGPLSMTLRDLEVRRETQTLAPVVVTAGASRVPVDVARGGLVEFPLVPGASLGLAAGAAQFPEGTPTELELILLSPHTMAVPVPQGFTAVAAAVLAPTGVTLSRPARLTLPVQGQVMARHLVLLLRLDDATQTYEQIGLGRVSADGTVINTLSGGLHDFSTVVFATTADDATKVFLLRLAGNNQQAQPGELLPQPLVVRLEDQFGNPVVGEAITATITRGNGSLVAADAVTDANGEARFAVRAGTDEEDLVVQVTAPEVAGVRPVQFFAIIGELNTPAIPRDIVVSGDVAYVADRGAGLLVIDIGDPARPELLHRLGLKIDRTIGPEARSLALQGTRLYLGAAHSARLYIVDISTPRAPNFATDTDGDGAADVVLAVLDFPGDILAQTIEDIAVQGHLVYAISNNFSTDPGTLYVVDVQDPMAPQILSITPLPTADPSGLIVLGDLVYVAAEAAGLLIFDVRDPAAPVLVATLGDPKPDDNIEVALSSGIALAGAFAYMVETQRNQLTNESTDIFTVLDLRTPEVPHRRGSVRLTTRPQLPLTKTGLTVTETFAYVGRGVFGLEALDIRNPDVPRRVGFVDTPSEALQVTTAGNFLYVIDSIFGLQVIQGPGPTEADTDGDGVLDFFDAFPTDPTESEDSDGDRLGDSADLDDDNDSFTDAEETAATPPTNIKDPLSFPVRVPPPGATTMVVDAATPLTARARQGTPEAPYRSLTEALRALRSGLAPAVDTLRVRQGIYSPFTTQEVIPLDLSRLSHLTVQAEVPGSVVLDGGFRGNVLNAELSTDLVIEGFVVTHGASGLSVQESIRITLRNNQMRENDEHGMLIGPNVHTGIVITDNLVENNGDTGIFVTGNTVATITQNTARANGQFGIWIAFGSTAEIRNNVTEHNGLFGITVLSNSTVTIAENISAQNEAEGIVIFDNSTATVTQNILRANRNSGIVIDVQSTAELRDNTIVGNGFPPNPSFPAFLIVGSGVDIEGGSVVTIHSGVITQNRVHGIYVSVSPLHAEPASVRVGLDSDAVVEITNNGRAGIFVEDDGSEAQIDSRQINFGGNAAGDTVGNVVDVAPGP
jgi:hypothetical protein